MMLRGSVDQNVRRTRLQQYPPRDRMATRLGSHNVPCAFVRSVAEQEMRCPLPDLRLKSAYASNLFLGGSVATLLGFQP